MAIKERVLNTGNARHAFEYLKLINDAPTEAEQVTLLKKWGGTVPLSMILSLNFNSNVVFSLPEGTPPHKRDESTHFDLFSPLATQIGRLKICLRSSDARKLDKERVFIQVLENISPQEGDVLIFAKDKALQEVYPNITPELVAKVFPNYVHS
jgi:hypothetical protein